MIMIGAGSELTYADNTATVPENGARRAGELHDRQDGDP